MKQIDLNENLISVRKARKIMSESLKNFKASTEQLNFKNTENRVLAENIISKRNIPEYDNSAVDGYAINFNSLKKNNFFKVVGESRPGRPFDKKLKIGEAIIIYTGSYILNKNKVDTVCYEENCNLKDSTLEIRAKPIKGSNIRKKGEDVKKNEIVFKKGRKVRAVDLAQMYSLGLKNVKVFKKKRIGVFSSGNEISSSFTKNQYKIYDANKLVLLALIKKIGCEAEDLGILEDNLERTKKLIFKNLKKFDLIITSGGVSKSKIDKIGSFFSSYGKISFWRLALKPGRPFAFGKIKKIPFIGLPGNPVAAIVTFLMLVTDYLKKFSGSNPPFNIARILPANFEMKKKVGRTEWLRGYIKEGKGKQFIERFKNSGSGIISSISKTDGIIEIEANKSFIKKGSMLKFYKYEDLLN